MRIDSTRFGKSASSGASASETLTPAGDGGEKVSEQFWVIASVVIIVLAAVLRFYDLDLVPLHHDEGVNGNFLVRLVREGAYQYNPENYHGPTLYYFAALFPNLLRILFGAKTQNSIGLTTTAIRVVPAIFGLATVLLVLNLRRNLGTIATLSAAFLLAVSPGAVYISRYFIHESLFAFFAFGLVVAALRYYESASPAYLLLAALSAALLFASKETAIISAVVVFLAWLVTRFYRALRNKTGDSGASNKQKKRRKPSAEQQTGFIARVGGPSRLALWILIALVVFIGVNVVFYSSFFTNFPKGIWDSIKTFEFWTKTGKRDHNHPFLTYFWWLLLQEAPLLLLAALGAILTVLRPTKAFALFSATWAFGLIVAYSLIKYKTPWLAVNFLVPLALSGGYALEWIYDELRRLDVGRSLRVAALIVVWVVVAGFTPGLVRAYTQKHVHLKTFIPGYQTLDLNFVNYDNDSQYYVYVYAHTNRELLKLLSEVDAIAQKTPQGNQTGITVVSREYWPLPWYLRNYTRVGYYGSMAQSNEPVIIASQDQAEEVETMFGDRYKVVQSGFNTAGSFNLRPGVELLLYTRRELVK
ncbi:MAG TPA: flippase activity-associated protein Agl23 [Pyrinomonadaceae bacterium]|nr:flippase activity-associated protein Agl23 [Pyrinomonadaceae bacterium]